MIQRRKWWDRSATMVCHQAIIVEEQFEEYNKEVEMFHHLPNFQDSRTWSICCQHNGARYHSFTSGVHWSLWLRAVLAAKTWYERHLSSERYQTKSDPTVIRKISKIMKTSESILVQKIASFNIKCSTFSCQLLMGLPLWEAILCHGALRLLWAEN